MENPHQALTVINNALGQLSATREVHMTLQQAVNIIAEAINTNEEKAKEDSDKKATEKNR